MNEIAKVERQPLEGTVVSRPQGALAQTDQQRAVAEVQAAMMIARANPRDQKTAVDRILTACQRQRLAEAAVYSYSRGGSEISGPSIRLAEALAQNWGNLQFGIREIEQRGGESTVQAFAWDVETNVKREMVFTVPHVRHTKKGSYKLDDPRDIYEMVANNGARRLRACILAVIPGDVIDMAVEECERTMRAKADVTPEGIQKIAAAFQQLGVTQQQLEARMQRRLDSIQPAQVVALKKIYASLRDGMSQVADWFEPLDGGEGEAPTKGNAGAKAALKAATGKAKESDASAEGNATASEDTAASSAEPESPVSGETAPNSGPSATTAASPSDDTPAEDYPVETNDEADPLTKDPADAAVEAILQDFARCEFLTDLGTRKTEANKHLPFMSEAHRELVENAYEKHKKRLSGKPKAEGK